MVEKIKFKENNFAEKARKFSEYYGEGEISEIKAEKVPQKALEIFKDRSAMLSLFKEQKPGDFENFFVYIFMNSVDSG